MMPDREIRRVPVCGRAHPRCRHLAVGDLLAAVVDVLLSSLWVDFGPSFARIWEKNQHLKSDSTFSRIWDHFSIDCKLVQIAQMEIQTKKKKANPKKITGFQFSPGNPSKVLVTSADSQIHIFNGVNLIHKFRGVTLAVTEKEQAGAQWTGIVTTIAVEMLKENIVDVVICVQSDPEDRPTPKLLLARSSHVIGWGS